MESASTSPSRSPGYEPGMLTSYTISRFIVPPDGNDPPRLAFTELPPALGRRHFTGYGFQRS